MALSRRMPVQTPATARRIYGSDSAGRERLLRYCARPPFALERLRIERHVEGHEQRSTTRLPGEAGIGQVRYHPARPTRDGRTVLVLSPRDFLAWPIWVVFITMSLNVASGSAAGGRKQPDASMFWARSKHRVRDPSS